MTNSEDNCMAAFSVIDMTPQNVTTDEAYGDYVPNTSMRVKDLCGIRPVIVLPSDISVTEKITLDGENIWNISGTKDEYINVAASNLDIGDIVLYSNSGEYTILSENSGALDENSNSLDQEISSETSGEFAISKWKVLNIGEDGTIELIAYAPTAGKITLHGAQGYNNGVKLLNDACNALYGNSSKGITGRSVNIEDFETKMGSTELSIDTSEHEINTVGYFYPNIYPLEKNSKINDGERLVDGLDISEQNQFYSGYTSLTSGNSFNLKFNYYLMAEADFSDECESAFYIENIEKQDDYWVASRYIGSIGGESYSFGIRYVDGDDKSLSGAMMVNLDTMYSRECKIFPVISVNVNQIKESNILGYRIQ